MFHLTMANTSIYTLSRDESSDYDSSCSSITVPETGQSWLSNLSFSSRRTSSVSVSSSATDTASLNGASKPHKENQVAWEAMKRLKSTRGGRVGLDHFRLLRRLGSGDIGNVYLCQIRNPGAAGMPEHQCLYAMKVVDREALALRKKLQRADMEKDILGMLDHPFLPTLYAEFKASHYSCLVMEFCPGGDLYAARLRRPGKHFPISTAKFYAAEVLLALEYLHMMGIIYRDLKPENVLVREDGHIMLSDFDLSLKCEVVPKLLRSRRSVSETAIARDDDPLNCYTTTCAAPIQPVLSCLMSSRKKSISAVERISTPDHLEAEYDQELVAEPVAARSKSFVGTHEYLAPEVISGQGHGSAVDWWTLGVFLYEILYGKTPFKGEHNERTLVNILKQPLSFPRIGVSTNKEYEEMVKVQDLISQLLVKNPKKRIGSVKGSIEIKRHEFFKGVNWALIRSVRPPEVPSNISKVVGSSRVSNNVNSSNYFPKLSKKEREAPYQISHNFDYF